MRLLVLPQTLLLTRKDVTLELPHELLLEADYCLIVNLSFSTVTGTALSVVDYFQSFVIWFSPNVTKSQGKVHYFFLFEPIDTREMIHICLDSKFRKTLCSLICKPRTLSLELNVEW
jgi:hypothetical protein